MRMVLTREEKRALLLLLGCFLLGALLYFIREGSLATGKERIEKKPAPDAQSKQEAALPPVLYSRKLNINTATQAELEKLPGVGAQMAENIVSKRQAKRRFYRLEELKEIKGIGEKKFEMLKEHLEVR